jgi:hypothetical protein
MMRIGTSAAPPGENGTISRTGRAGYGCAAAPPAAMSAVTASASIQQERNLANPIHFLRYFLFACFDGQRESYHLAI